MHFIVCVQTCFTYVDVNLFQLQRPLIILRSLIILHSVVFLVQIVEFCGDEHKMAMKEKNSVSRNKVEMVQIQDSNGRVVECLKKNFLNRIITNVACKQVQIFSISNVSHVTLFIENQKYADCYCDNTCTLRCIPDSIYIVF